MSAERDIALIDELRAAMRETACVEFKENNTNPESIGKYISALSNAAALNGIASAYIIWGVLDADFGISGTTFDPDAEKNKGQPLKFWLAQNLSPEPATEFRVVAHPEGRVVMLEISAAAAAPVEFDGTAYIRIGSATPKLSSHPDQQRALWAKIQPNLWEIGNAKTFVESPDVLSLLDYRSYFDLTEQQLPAHENAILERLEQERLIIADVKDRWNITNLGALLFANRFSDFPDGISRRAVRFIAYEGADRTAIVRHRQEDVRGYASGFAGLLRYINDVLPLNEHIGQAFRTEARLFPEIAIRELVANALIHQDLTVSGTGPVIEWFSDRLEISNPGAPLVAVDRLIDAPPRSRNEKIAALMRRMKLCEELGTGLDKVVAAAELFQLPAPEFIALDTPPSMRAIIYGPRSFGEMTVEERIRACYHHAVLKRLAGREMTNATLRERLGVAEKNKSQISKVITAALERGKICPADPDRPRSGYVPYWAAPELIKN